MKVLYMLDTLNRGGTETLVLDICKFKAKPFDLTVCSAKGGALENDIIASGVNYLQYGRKFSFDINSILKVRNILKKGKFDLVHTHLWIDALFVTIAKVGLKIKLAHSFHAFDTYRNRKYLATIRFIMKRTDINFFVSGFVKDHYLKNYKSHSNNYVLYNGVNESKFLVEQKDIRDELGLSITTKVFGMVGNFINTGRDQITICRALPQVIEKYPDFHFLFIGRKSEEKPWIFDECVNYCKEYGIQGNVHFLGARTDVPSLIMSLDAFVYATNHDTFGIAIVEAMMVGLPVLANDYSVIKEVTKDGKYCTLYRTKDVQDLAKKLEYLILGLESYKNVAKRNISEVRKKYSIVAHIKELEKQYKRIVC
ncbi:glycosyltransferase family 4 protein [Pontibacter fetidus]|uniref:Glycosyltransferase family 4 protein n=1 Tax=Pontibacter fetidus TaxID=2700082 RepID=A0A6B2H2I5_9BACT|nr:glycosyltransferase family 4 protein [Pontibacter fetidus]NDK57509.1 glycosyltransferase family 4 protein [Pontibacter fetidus]